MYKLFMAFRYLRAHKIIYFSIAGVAIGIMTMVIVISVMAGFQRDMRAKIRGMQAHIIVTPSSMTHWFENYDPLCEELLKVSGVKAAAPRVEWEAWLGQGGDFRDVHIVGIDPSRERNVSDLESYFKRGSKGSFDFRDSMGQEPQWPGVVLGSELSHWIGRRVGLMTARQVNTPAFFVKDFEYVGSFNSGMSEYDSKYVFMHLSSAQDFLKLAGQDGGRPVVNAIALSVDDYERHGRKVRDAVLEALHAKNPCDDPEYQHSRKMRCGLYTVRTWEQARRVLMQAVEVEKGIQMLLLFLIVLVAGFNIIAIYTLVVRSKTRDIGILRALGATEGGVTSIFLMSGGLCGMFGSFFGIVLGLLVSFNLNEIEDVIRVVSREVNLTSRASQGISMVALLGALYAFLWTWGHFYKDRPRRPWLRIAASTLTMALAGVAYTTWMSGRGYAEWGGSTRWVVLAAMVGGWVAFMLAWRGAAPFRRRPGWVLFGFGGTIVLIAYFLAILAALLIVAFIFFMRPDHGWPGLELFPKSIYYLEKIPVLVDYTTLAYIVGVTLAVSVIFSIYPALRAAKANPIEAIRDE
jgi:lipoprotein-releasing system permease protein